MEEDEENYTFSVLEEDLEDEAPPEEETNMMMVVRKVLLSEPRDEEKQRHNLFRTRCKVGEKTCNVIIDGGAQTDIVASEAVSKLRLPTREHQEPYKLKWVNDS